jgi:hypothetical protein
VFKTKGVVAHDSRINVRITEGERQHLEQDARLAGVSMSEVVRSRFFDYPLAAQVDIQMIGVLRKAAALLKHVHNESAGMYSEDTAAAIRALKTLAEEICASR